MQTALKTAKADLAKKTEELGDAQEELATLQESSKEREKALKQKLKDMTLEKDRLAGLEVSRRTLHCALLANVRQDELEAMKASARSRSVSQSVQPEESISTKTVEEPKPKAKKELKPMPPVIEITAPDEDDEIVVEKPKKAKATTTTTTPKSKARKVSHNRLQCLPFRPRRRIVLTVQTAPVTEQSDAGSDYEAPSTKKKARTPARSVSPAPHVAKAKKPLGETGSDNLSGQDDAKMGTPFKVMKPLVVKKKAKDKDREGTADGDAQPEKKKKRKLLGVQPAFQWDSIMSVSYPYPAMICKGEGADLSVWRWSHSLDAVTAQADHGKGRHPPYWLFELGFLEDSFAFLAWTRGPISPLYNLPKMNALYFYCWMIMMVQHGGDMYDDAVPPWMVSDQPSNLNRSRNLLPQMNI